MRGVLVSFWVVFVAELGDRSQLMALAFAARYDAKVVLSAITLSTAVVHLASVAAGAVLAGGLPETGLQIAGGIAFFAFGAWTLRGDELRERDEQRVSRPVRAVFPALCLTFVLSELGDKTMLATIALATREGAVGVWLGSTAGMVAADAIAVLAGRRVADRLSARSIRIGAASLFFAGGAAMLFSAAT